MSNINDEKQDSQWCLVGNIVDRRRVGEGGLKIVPGTKHFSKGTKVYCLPAQWGDGYDQIKVVGRHRGSKKFVTMIISSSWVTNYRAKVVYNPEVLRRIKMATSETWQKNWDSEDEVKIYLNALLKR